MIKRQTGVTIIELLVVVTVIGILAGIAYPSYREHMLRTSRSDAQIALLRIAAAQEKFYSDCSWYAGILVGAARDCATSASGVLSYQPSGTILSPDRHYRISFVAATAACPLTSCFVIEATPAVIADGGTGRQTGDGALRIDSLGNRTWNRKGAGTWVSWTSK